MKVIEVELEDGRRYELQVDDEASRPEIEAEIDLLKARVAKPTDVTEQMSTLERFRAGIGRGMVNVGRQLGNIAGFVSDEELAQARELDRPLMETTAGQVGSFAGEIATTAPLAGGLVAGGGRALMAARPGLQATATARPIATGAATGAAEGAVEGAILGGPGERAAGAVGGALGGTVGGAALPFIARGFRQPGAGSQTLQAMGLELTPGQQAPAGVWNQIEEAAKSYPFVGQSVKTARERPQEQFAQQMIQAGRPPGTQPVDTGKPSDMLSDVYDKFEAAYAQFKGFDVSRQTVGDLEDGFLDASFTQDYAIDPQTRSSVFDYLTNKLGALENRAVKTEDLIKIRSDLRKEIKRKKSSQKLDDVMLMERAETSISKAINRSIPAQQQQQLTDVDLQYKKHKIAEDALRRAGDRGSPTPFQWSKAVEKSAASGSEYARGGGLLRDEVEAAREAFEVVSPATGQRVATLGALGGLGAGALGVVGMNDPMAAAYIGMPLALFAATRRGQRAATGQLPSQEMMRHILSQTVVPGAVARGMLPVHTEGE